MFNTIMNVRLAELHIHHHEASGLNAIIAIHNTRFGPALGGCRCLHYPDPDTAITDAIRLAEGMSYKAALAGLPQGGGKAVIVLPPPLTQIDRPRLFRAFGDLVESLGGRYITAVDSGTELEDLDRVAERTAHVVGTASDGNDPSPMTAIGVLEGIRTAVQHRLGRSQLGGLRVTIQGAGHVGSHLARGLTAAGARLLISDNQPQRAEALARELGAEVIPVGAVYDSDCDVFAPCALGAVLNPDSIARLRCQVVAGSANNQLACPACADLLHKRGILYAPDYVINAGGLIQVSLAHLHRQREIPAQVNRIAHTLADIFLRATREDLPTALIADRLAHARLYGKEA